jgi:hypothetical protein
VHRFGLLPELAEIAEGQSTCMIGKSVVNNEYQRGEYKKAQKQNVGYRPVSSLSGKR